MTRSKQPKLALDENARKDSSGTTSEEDHLVEMIELDESVSEDKVINEDDMSTSSFDWNHSTNGIDEKVVKINHYKSSKSRRKLKGRNGKLRKNGTSKCGIFGSLQYKLMGIANEESHPNNIYGISFNHFIARSCGEDVFATCGDKTLTVYECHSDGSFHACISYSDPDEVFYSCDWSYCSTTGNPWLIAAGKKGLIRVIDTMVGQAVQTFISHGGAINDLKINQNNAHMLLTASKDSSIRLWNLTTFTLVAIFAGIEGHRDEVVSVSFHQSLPYFVSSGIDYAIKIWKLNTEQMIEAWNRSNVYISKFKHGCQFRTEHVHVPFFSTRDIHHNYVDCVEWFGDLIISRSCEEEIIIWKPCKNVQNQSIDLLAENIPQNDLCLNEDIDVMPLNVEPNSTRKNFKIIGRIPVEKSDVWYIRFAMDRMRDLLAIGNTEGAILLVDLKSMATNCELFKEVHIERMKIPPHQSVSSKYVRQIGFNYNGTSLVAVTDGSHVIKYDFNRI